MMLPLVVSGLALIIGYISAHLVARYSLALYIDPDEVESLYPKLSRSQRTFLTRLAHDPRAFVQMAIVFKSFVLIALTGVVVYMTANAVPPWSAYATVFSITGLVFHWCLYLFIVEYLPRRFSRRAINTRLVGHLWFIRLIWMVFFPVVHLSRTAFKRSASGERVSEEEKDDIVERAIETLAEQAGISEAIVEAEEKEMIGHIFQLDQTIVREIMVPRIDIVAINRTMTFTEIRKLVLEDGHSRYPVFEKTIDKVVGMLYVKDLFGRMPEPGEKFVISKYLRKPFFIPETKVIRELLNEFKMRRLHIAMVVDEYGGVAGLVTLEDIIEEIFGEIQDEHDWEEAPFVPLRDGRLRVDAGVLVEELQNYLDSDYEQGDFDTVGGLIYDLVGSVPKEGQRVKWHDIEFEIDRVEGQRIVYVNVRHQADAAST